MKVLLLAPATSIHTRKWAEGLAGRGIEVVVATQHPAVDWPSEAKVKVVVLPFRGILGYFLNAGRLRTILASEKPDLMNAHYASGYGTTARLSGFSPYLLSVWGSDVFDFPHESWLKKSLLVRNLRGADRLASTSEVMREEVMTLVDDVRTPLVTPFGVDTEVFALSPPRPSAGHLVVGTVKALYQKYGIDVLIEAFARIHDVDKRRGDPECRLRIVGAGPERVTLERLSASLGIAEVTDFIGAVPHSKVPQELQKLDIFVASSRLDSESFGVAVVEASSTGLPVVVSDVAGLSEVVDHGVTGIVVPKDDPVALANALSSLLSDRPCRERMGASGRRSVLARYEWGHCVDQMIVAYNLVIDDFLSNSRQGTGGRPRTPRRSPIDRRRR